MSHYSRIIVLSAALIACLGCATTDQSDPKPAPGKIVETKVTFLAVGDIMLSRGVAQRINGANDSLLPFRKLEAILKSTDFNFGNLETPVSGRDHVLGVKKIFNTRVQDTQGLTEYNFKVLNLANNHAFDQGAAGLKATRILLDKLAITHVGAGDNLDEAWQPKFFTANNLRIGFIGASYASYNDGGVARHDYVARIEDVASLKRAIAQSKAKADYTIVTMHAGTEFVDKVDPRRGLDRGQIDFAHAAIDHGADLVIGAHPHWIQNLETYKGKLIFYSLGNFIFDMFDPIANEGLVLKVTLRGERSTWPFFFPLDDDRQVRFKTRLEEIECIPVIIENKSTPRLASEEETTRILKRLNLPRKVNDDGKSLPRV